MTRKQFVTLPLATGLGAVLTAPTTAEAQFVFPPKTVPPELREVDEWINTDQPLRLEAQKGKVVVVNFWTFG